MTVQMFETFQQRWVKHKINRQSKSTSELEYIMLKQPILVELQYFVAALDRRNLHKPNTPNLVRCSLVLLEHLPSARDAVFEYFALVFDTSVGEYLTFVDKSNSNGGQQEEDAITDIQNALENLITNGPMAWSPLIAHWSLRLLGQLSGKHSRRIMDIGTACNFWLQSNGIRTLIGLAALCFSKLNVEEKEDMEDRSPVAGLLATYRQHSPHFDWVVARLGGCFPAKVISQILQCGLKGFTSNCNSTLESEVGILSYLSHSHEKDLNNALMDLMKSVMTASSNNVQMLQISTVPYLLHLAEMSDVLLQPIMNIFLELYDEAAIQAIKVQATMWPNNYKNNNILTLLTNLILKTKRNGIRMLLLLAKLADRHQWCQDLLELVLIELESIVLDDSFCLLLDDIVKDDTRQLLWRACSSAPNGKSKFNFQQQTGVRLILLQSSKSPYLYYQTISQILINPSSDQGPTSINSLARILGGSYGVTDTPDVKPGLQLALDSVQLADKKNQQQIYNILKNSLAIIRLEKGATSPFLKKTLFTQAAQECLAKFFAIWEQLLLTVTLFPHKIDESVAPRLEVGKKAKKENGTAQAIQMDDTAVLKESIHLLAHLLDQLDVYGKISSLTPIDILKLASLTVKYFFWCLCEPDVSTRLSSTTVCFSLLAKQCGRKMARASAIRELLEGAFFSYGSIFTSPKTNAENGLDNDKDKNDDLLIVLNQKQGNGMNVSRSSVLHSGVIGRGPRIAVRETADPNGPDKEVKNLFLNALVACCVGVKDVDASEQTTLEGFSFVALLLVEMVSTDVMYNGLPWPDEEFTKVTMERDLQIRRSFKNIPILWSILGLIAAHRPSLCYCSVLLRALCASVLHQWKAKSAQDRNGNNTELMFVTTKLLEVMTLGQLLPPPLSYLHVAIQYLEPQEIAVVLRECVWNYMKENVPSPVLFISDANGLFWRDPATAKPPPQFVDPLRNTMQKKIAKVGQLYHLMFVMPPAAQMPDEVGAGAVYPIHQHMLMQQQVPLQPVAKMDTMN